MGNYSRNTFNPTKGYVSVRLQQGVPLVDADWNELSDVTRHEAYRATAAAGAAAGLSRPTGFFTGGPNNPLFSGGAGVVAGRPFDVGNIIYDNQRWRDPTLAAADGVPVIPPLTTPTSNRDDICYLDIWERELGRTEDPNIVNPAIGVETCVRLRREVAMRVAEGTTTVPAAPAGHAHLPLAIFHRPAGNDTIGPPQREDIYVAVNVASFAPTFLPVAWGSILAPAWLLTLMGRLSAFKPTNQQSAVGLLPLTLPSGVNITAIRVTGQQQGVIRFELWRWPLAPSGALSAGEQIHLEVLPATGGATFFDRSFFPSAPDRTLVNNRRFAYGLIAEAPTTGPVDIIFGVSVRYSS